MLTQKGMEILLKMYSLHRSNFLETHDGCNRNDCERDFLHNILSKVSGSYNEIVYAKLANEIESIR